MWKLLSYWLIPAALAESEATGLAALPLFEKGLIVTGVGLLGVFLVLFLFYLTIKWMQKLK